MVDESLSHRVDRLFYDLREEIRITTARTDQRLVAVQEDMQRIEKKLEVLEKTRWGPVQWAIVSVGGMAVTVLGGILALVFQAGP